MAVAKIEHELAARGEGCLGKAHDDEPLFILRGQDKLAPEVVRIWAVAAKTNGCSPAKVAEAQAIADAMELWSKRKFPD